MVRKETDASLLLGFCLQPAQRGVRLLLIQATLTRTRLSRSRFICNQVRLALFVPAHNLGNSIRRFAFQERSPNGPSEAFSSSSSR